MSVLWFPILVVAGVAFGATLRVLLTASRGRLVSAPERPATARSRCATCPGAAVCPQVDDVQSTCAGQPGG